jgi:uncharacterized protein (DUF433 family)
MATNTPIEPQPRVSIEHIEIDEHGNAKLAGHRIKVKHLVGIMRTQGYTAERLQSEAYPHLRLSQVYSALAYYHDHQAEIDRQIQEDDEIAEVERQKQLNDPEHQKRVATMKARWAVLQAEKAKESDEKHD